MATDPLPAQPNLDHLRGQARDLQRAVRSGDPGAVARAGLTGPAPAYPLTRAQLVVARSYGFATWARLRHHVDALSARTWVPLAARSGRVRGRRVPAAGLSQLRRRPAARWRRAEELLRTKPELAKHDLAVAAVAADATQVRRQLSRDAAAATRPFGPYGWSPLMYAAYARVGAGLEATVTTSACCSTRAPTRTTAASSSACRRRSPCSPACSAGASATSRRTRTRSRWRACCSRAARTPTTARRCTTGCSPIATTSSTAVRVRPG